MSSHVLTAEALRLIAFCIFAEVSRELLFKVAADSAQDSDNYALAVALKPAVWLGIFLWAVEVVAWVVLLQKVPLSIAFPLVNLNYAGVPIASALFLKERLRPKQMLGAALVAVGVFCIGLAGI